MNKAIRLTLLALVIFTSAIHAAQRDTIIVKHWLVDSVDREAMVYVPASAGTKPTPVIFVFHGHGGNMRNILRSLAFQKLWPDAIVIAPQGLKTPGRLVDKAGNFPGWQQEPGDMQDRDIHFFDAMLHTLEQDYQVDHQRIYATGHSNGGTFTYLLWAMRGDVFAAVAPSGSVAFRFAKMLSPKPAMHIMGEHDPLVKPEWQKATCAMLLKLDQCSAEGQPFAEFATLYPSSIGEPVVLYVHPGGHTYTPGAAAAAVKFFKSVAKP